MPISVQKAAIVAYDREIHVIGGTHNRGENDSDDLDFVQIYDPEADKWRRVDMAQPIAIAQAVARPGWSLVLTNQVWNARKGRMRAEPAAWRYQVHGNKWERLDLPLPRHINYHPRWR
ncbi:MAG: hypothetical protein CMJ18_14675 [Phycisphaeraceae bacterium]|nr:hypothetical protein [Phycisphaeraceae bacterium]